MHLFHVYEPHSIVVLRMTMISETDWWPYVFMIKNFMCPAWNKCNILVTMMESKTGRRIWLAIESKLLNRRAIITNNNQWIRFWTEILHQKHDTSWQVVTQMNSHKTAMQYCSWQRYTTTDQLAYARNKSTTIKLHTSHSDTIKLVNIFTDTFFGGHYMTSPQTEHFQKNQQLQLLKHFNYLNVCWSVTN